MLTKPEWRELFYFLARTFWNPGTEIGMLILEKNGMWFVLDRGLNLMVSGWEGACPDGVLRRDDE